MHVLIVSCVSDRNGERTIQTEDSGFYGVNPDNLLWIEHFSLSVPIDHKINHLTYSVKNAGSFCGPGLYAIILGGHLGV